MYIDRQVNSCMDGWVDGGREGGWADGCRDGCWLDCVLGGRGEAG